MSTIELASFLDGIDLDEDDEPMHIGRTNSSPVALCGFVFDGDETLLPWEEVPDSECCAACVRIEEELLR